MLYDQFLFFPANTNLPQKDSIGRLNALQVLVNHHPALNFTGYKATDKMLAVIIGMLKRWLNLESDEEANTLVDICNKACPDEALPKSDKT